MSFLLSHSLSGLSLWSVLPDRAISSSLPSFSYLLFFLFFYRPHFSFFLLKSRLSELPRSLLTFTFQRDLIMAFRPCMTAQADLVRSSIQIIHDSSSMEISILTDLVAVKAPSLLICAREEVEEQLEQTNGNSITVASERSYISSSSHYVPCDFFSQNLGFNHRNIEVDKSKVILLSPKSFLTNQWGEVKLFLTNKTHVSMCLNSIPHKYSRVTNHKVSGTQPSKDIQSYGPNPQDLKSAQNQSATSRQRRFFLSSLSTQYPRPINQGSCHQPNRSDLLMLIKRHLQRLRRSSEHSRKGSGIRNHQSDFIMSKAHKENKYAMQSYRNFGRNVYCAVAP